jgi:hypothetical protein
MKLGDRAKCPWRASYVLLSALCLAGCLLPEVFEASTNETGTVDAPASPVAPREEVSEAPPEQAPTVDTTMSISAAGTAADPSSMADAAAGTAAEPSSMADAAAGSVAPWQRECAPDGLTRCTLSYMARERCVAGRWQDAPCESNAVCSSNRTLPAGTCVQKSPKCAGLGGKHLCEQGRMITCSLQEVGEEQPCPARLCSSVAGCQKDHCPNGETRCSQGTLSRCEHNNGPAYWQVGIACPEGTTCPEGATSCR